MTALLFLAPLLGLTYLLWALARLQQQGTHPHGKIRQRHHGYYGVVVALVGAWMLGHPLGGGWVKTIGGVLFALGMWWLIDDGRQHRIQFTRPSFLSPWHRFAAKVGIIR